MKREIMIKEVKTEEIIASKQDEANWFGFGCSGKSCFGFSCSPGWMNG